MFDSNSVGGLAVYGSQMQQLGNAKPPSLYDQHENAVQEYHAACHAFQEVQARREKAKLQLEKVTQELSTVIQNALYDPASPNIPAPTNGAVWVPNVTPVAAKGYQHG